MQTDLEEDLDYFEIDPDRLCEEWLRQLKIYRKHTHQLADARSEHERAKAQKEVVEAELDKDIRLHPEKYDMDKITDKAVERAIVREKAYQKATEECIKARHTMDICQADVDTLDQKKKALENAVRLQIANLWGEPNAKGEAKESAREYEIQQIRRHGQKRRGE